MRQIKRIPIILEVLKDKTNKLKVLNYLFKPAPRTRLKFDDAYVYINDILDIWENHYKEFSKLWIENPDLRLTQVLVNAGISSNFPGLWYFFEDEEIIVNTNILQPRDIYFWGQQYDKNSNKLPETNFILIKDMETSHIEKILNLYHDLLLYVSETYITYFIDELEFRNNNI